MAFIISRFDGDLTEARQHPGELQQGLPALHQREVGQPDLLDELELDKLRHAVGLAHPEHASDDVLRAVAELPEVVQQLECFVYIISDLKQWSNMSLIRIGLGSSQTCMRYLNRNRILLFHVSTLKTFSDLTKLNPSNVD